MTHRTASRFGSEVLDSALSDAELAWLHSADNGFSDVVGIRFTRVAADGVSGYVDIGSHHHQPAGVVNGGVFASIGETLGSVAAIAAAGGPALGMSNHTEFLRSVRDGRVVGTAVPVHLGRSTHLWRIDMVQGGRLVATTSLRMMISRGATASGSGETTNT